MKKMLITGFDPFGGESINPAWEAVKGLPDVIGPYALTKLQIPTVFNLATDTVLNAAQSLCPDVILCVGQAGGRDAVTPERIAINLMDSSIPDNHGSRPTERPCVAGGPDAYFATVPVRAMADAIVQAGLPGKVSLSAGAFVCNDTLYRLLHHYHASPTRVGFIHVPYLPQQAKPGVPSIELGDIIKALALCIESIV